jgi:hypothetical protein
VITSWLGRLGAGACGGGVVQHPAATIAHSPRMRRLY